jgi:hypothetical protein
MAHGTSMLFLARLLGLTNILIGVFATGLQILAIEAALTRAGLGLLGTAAAVLLVALPMVVSLLELKGGLIDWLSEHLVVAKFFSLCLAANNGSQRSASFHWGMERMGLGVGRRGVTSDRLDGHSAFLHAAANFGSSPRSARVILELPAPRRG